MWWYSLLVYVLYMFWVGMYIYIYIHIYIYYICVYMAYVLWKHVCVGSLYNWRNSVSCVLQSHPFWRLKVPPGYKKLHILYFSWRTFWITHFFRNLRNLVINFWCTVVHTPFGVNTLELYVTHLGIFQWIKLEGWNNFFALPSERNMASQ